MKLFKYIKSLSILLFSATIFTTSTICLKEVNAAPLATNNLNIEDIREEQLSSPLNIVNSPKLYLNKNIIMKAKFDKFSTLGLDYKVALRSSEDYISFLIKRDDTTHDIPLSEMKLFLKRDLAEKYIDLKTNDEIKITGNVFSDALGDPWIDVSSIIITKKAPEIDKNGENK